MTLSLLPLACCWCLPPAGKYYKDGHEYSYDHTTKTYTPYTDGYSSYGKYHGSPVYPPPAPYAPAPYGYVSVPQLRLLCGSDHAAMPFSCSQVGAGVLRSAFHLILCVVWLLAQDAYAPKDTYGYKDTYGAVSSAQFGRATQASI